MGHRKQLRGDVMSKHPLKPTWRERVAADPEGFERAAWELGYRVPIWFHADFAGKSGNPRVMRRILAHYVLRRSTDKP